MCNQWLGFARAQLRNQLQRLPSSTTLILNPVEDVEIIITTRPNNIKIIAGHSIYLESGFLNLLSSGKCSELAYRPAILNYNNPVRSYINSVSNPLERGINIRDNTWITIPAPPIPEGSRSLSVGCSSTLDQVTDACGVTYHNKGYCDPEKILMKKKCNALIPSSLFTGKMRLFVQTLYGSNRSDYYCNWDFPVFDYKLRLASGHALSGFSQSNSWLVTVGDHEYYLFIYRTIEIDYYKVNVTDNGLRALIAAETNSDTKFKLEAYLLSTASIEKTKVTLTVPTGQQPKGLALASAGWSWSNDGMMGNIICHETDNAARDYIARHYTMILTEHINTGGVRSFTADIVQLTADHWWPIDGVVNVVIPFYEIGDTTMFTPATDKPYKGLLGSIPLNQAGSDGFSAPVYVYRDKTDSVKLVSFTYAMTVSYVAVDLKDTVLPAQGEYYVAQDLRQPGGPGNNLFYGSVSMQVGDELITRNIRHSGAEVFDERFPVGDVLYSGWEGFIGSGNLNGGNPGVTGVQYGATTVDGTQTWDQWMRANGYYTNAGGYVFTGETVQSYRTDGISQMFDVYYEIQFFASYYGETQISVTSRDQVACLFFELPFNSMNSFFYGDYSENTIVGQYTISTNGTAPPSPGSNYWTYGWQVVKIVSYFAPDNSITIRLYAVVGDIIRAQANPVAYHSLDWTQFVPYQYSVNKNIYYKDYLGNTQTITSVSNDTGAPMREWHFDQTILNPLLGTIEPSRTCYTGSNYNFQGNTVRFDYPDDNSVGWA